jgi:uncharacterized NAD(P)/FAD-binding protein YdhS
MKMQQGHKRLVVAVIGGGFSGAALAIHLQTYLPAGVAVRTLVFEPRETLGTGLAYSTSEPTSRINVPAGRMTVYPDQPEHFTDYLARTDALASDADAVLENGNAYPQRSVFGAYVTSEIAPLLSSGTVTHHRSPVVHVEHLPDGWLLQTADGEEHFADITVIATSHPPPDIPRSLSHLAGHAKLVADVNAPNAFKNISADDRVLIVGNGLTAADAFAALKQRGHKGNVLSVSRRGLRSRGHPSTPQEPFGDFVNPPPRSASQLLKRVRLAIRKAEMAGFSWHGVIDAVRIQGGGIWKALPLAERCRIARWVRPFWDVHRFRIAPQVERELDKAVASGSLHIEAGALRSATTDASGKFQIGIRFRGDAEPSSIEVDAMVITTGPAHGGILSSQPFLQELAKAGHLTNCATGLGILCDEHSRAIDQNGRPVETLLIGGPLARGTFGELMGLPQVTEHAVFVAQEVAQLLSASSKTKPVTRSA